MGYYQKTVTILAPTDQYKYEVAGTGEGTHSLEVTIVEDDVISFGLRLPPGGTAEIMIG